MREGYLKFRLNKISQAGAGRLTDAMIDFVASLCAMNVDNTEYALLAAIATFSGLLRSIQRSYIPCFFTERSDIQGRTTIADIQDVYTSTLQVDVN